MYKVYNPQVNNLPMSKKASGDRIFTSGTERQFKIPKAQETLPNRAVNC